MIVILHVVFQCSDVYGIMYNLVFQILEFLIYLIKHGCKNISLIKLRQALR